MLQTITDTFNSQFSSPQYGWLFLLLPLLAVVYFRFTNRRKSGILFSYSMFGPEVKKSWRQYLVYLPAVLRGLAIILLITAMLRPQKVIGLVKTDAAVVDIVMVLDISSSMELEDFSPNRLEIAKKNINNFIDKRFNDRLGLVIFGKEAFLQCPLTLDHDLLKNFVENIDFIENISQQTAIGLALMTAIISLKDSKAKSKVIILVTDGENNAGDVDPFTAAEIAKKYGISIHSIGIGIPGKSMVNKTVSDPFFGKRQVAIPTVMDEESLKKVSEITGGRYFNVQNQDKFEATYQAIDELEKTVIEQEKFQKYHELFPNLLKLAFILLLLELFLSQTILRRNPL